MLLWQWLPCGYGPRWGHCSRAVWAGASAEAWARLPGMWFLTGGFPGQPKTRNPQSPQVKARFDSLSLRVWGPWTPATPARAKSLPGAGDPHRPREGRNLPQLLKKLMGSTRKSWKDPTGRVPRPGVTGTSWGHLMPKTPSITSNGQWSSRDGSCVLPAKLPEPAQPWGHPAPTWQTCGGPRGSGPQAR